MPSVVVMQTVCLKTAGHHQNVTGCHRMVTGHHKDSRIVTGYQLTIVQ